MFKINFFLSLDILVSKITLWNKVNRIDFFDKMAFLRKNVNPPLHKKCPYLDLFWSAFSRIQTEYGEIQSISPYSVQMWKMRTRITPNTDTFHAIHTALKIYFLFIALRGI